jgi:hypothetical protein
MRERFPVRFSRGKRGQTVVEYLLTTLALVTVFAGMYGVLQGSGNCPNATGLKQAFCKAGLAILTPRY